MHLGWYHTGSGSPREVAHIFGAVKYAPDGKTLVFCSNQPTIDSSVQAFDRLADLRDAKQAEITKLPAEQRQGRDAHREAAQGLVSEARTPNTFQLYTVDVQGGRAQPVPGTNTDWPAEIVWVGP